MVGVNKFHGHTPFGCDIPLPGYVFATDACLTGGGGHFADDWFHSTWSVDSPELVGSNINILELQTVLLAARRWGHLLAGRHILVRSDNVSTVSAVNRSTSRSSDMMKIVKELFWVSVEYGFKLSAKHLPGKLNVLADCLSRLDSVFTANRANFLLSGAVNVMLYGCCSHMSYGSFLLLQKMWSETLLIS